MSILSVSRIIVISVLFVVSVVVGYSIGRLYFKLTDGFGPGAIALASREPTWEEKNMPSSLADLLSQKYTYMAKGAQSYVLCSDDQRYVIKFFKRKHLGFPSWQQTLSRLPMIGAYFSETQRRREEKQKRIFSGCQLAYQAMPQDSGVIYTHLSLTANLPSQLVIVDKLGRRHLINPNDVAFYIQRKGESVYPTLKQFKRSGDLEGASNALKSLFAYLVDRSKRGILDQDPNYINNLGFIDGQPATLDVGDLVFDPMIRNPAEYLSRIIDHTQAIKRWSDANFADLSFVYEQNIAELRANLAK